MRIDDKDENTYQIYKTEDKLVDVVNPDSDSELTMVYEEYNKLENENIIRKRKRDKVLSRLSQELDKLNKYPAISSINSDSHNYIYTQVYLFTMSIIYFILVFYFKTIFAIIFFPLVLIIGYKVGIIENNNY